MNYNNLNRSHVNKPVTTISFPSNFQQFLLNKIFNLLYALIFHSFSANHNQSCEQGLAMLSAVYVCYQKYIQAILVFYILLIFSIKSVFFFFFFTPTKQSSFIYLLK